MTRLEKCELAVKKGFTYNEENGFITTPTGVIASKKTVNGYVMLTIRNEVKKSFYLLGHQFAWFILYNEIVPLIDHKNRIKTDNSKDNLRSITKSQNAMNMNNVKGYYYSKRDNKYISFIMLNYKTKQLGSFNTELEARNCYLQNKEKYHIINN